MSKHVSLDEFVPSPELILHITRSIPEGKVMSYGQIAAYLGFPNGAREVGRVMRSIDVTDNFPWWRVLSSTGKVSLKDNPQLTPEMQQRRLEDEGVIFYEELMLDMPMYRYRPDAKTLVGFGVDTDDVDELQAKFSDTKKNENPAQTSLFSK